MPANNTTNSTALIRQQVYANEIYPPLLPYLMNDTFVHDVSADFSDGDTYNIPQMGQASIRQRTEDEDTRVDNISTSRFQMAITEFPETAVGLTRKMREDSYIWQKFVSQIIPVQRNAVLQRYETVLMQVQRDQTSGDFNNIDGVPHRFIASGTNNVLTTADFDDAAYALDTANIPTKNRFAIISPGMARSLKREIGNVNIAFNRDFLGIPSESIREGLNVSIEIGGFQVIVSNFADQVATETIDGDTITNARTALFFSIADEYCKPIARGWRRPPTADMYVDRSKDDLEVYRLNARFGVGLVREQGLVTILATDPTVGA
jgi:hypothetical protein